MYNKLNFTQMKAVKFSILVAITTLAFFGMSIGTINAQVCSIGTINYATLDLALADVPTGGATPTTIKLLAHIDYSGELRITNKKIMFDLNGKHLDVNSPGHGLLVDNGGNVFLTGIGNFNVTGNEGTYINASSDIATVTNATGAVWGVYARQGGELTVLGNVTAIAENGIGAYAGGGGGSGVGTKITIDGTITVPATGTYIRVGSTDKTIDDYEAVTTKPGYFTYTDGTNTVWVKNPNSPVCSIGTTNYTALSLALADVPTGGATPTTIKLLANINHAAQIAVTNKKITFDLNGYNLNVISASHGLLAESGGNVSLSGAGNFNVKGGYGTYINGSSDKATITNATGGSRGVFARQGAELIVLGNVTATDAGGVGAYAGEIYNSNTKITIDGTITVHASGTYIRVGDVSKTINDYEAVTTKEGYLTYTDGSNTVWVKGTSTAIKTIKLPNIEIYPNPAKYELKITNYEGRINKVEIYDLTGKTVNSQWMNGQSINIANLPQGIYFVKIETDGGVVTRKFIKE